MNETKIFGKRRKFGMPDDCFILFALPKREWSKLDEWVKKKEQVTVIIGSDGEVALLNETKLGKSHLRFFYIEEKVNFKEMEAPPER